MCLCRVTLTAEIRSQKRQQCSIISALIQHVAPWASSACANYLLQLSSSTKPALAAAPGPLSSVPIATGILS